jgi:O6-methylguanine-DNA--protein-cysteine methyltransferase
VIPCHRVVGSGNKLNGYKYGLDIKAHLLHLEGYQVDGETVLR